MRQGMSNGEAGNIKEYRKQQARIAHYRDSGLCVRHYFFLNESVRATQTHHVYGRDKKTPGKREHYTSLLSLCTSCHDVLSPLTFKRTLPTGQEILLNLANVSPINTNFSHENAD